MPSASPTGSTAALVQAAGAERADGLVGLIGLYDDPDTFIAAAAKVRDAGYTRWDCHTPYPVHGLDDAMGLKPSPMPYITLGAGALGASLAMLMQWWMSAVDFPVRIGGKPLFSWPAFIPITFELFVLFAALATMGGMIALAKLGRWASPLHDNGCMLEVVTTRLGIVLEAEDENFSEAGARALLEGSGCKDVRPLYAPSEEEEDQP
jgi:hypothetical protein